MSSDFENLERVINEVARQEQIVQRYQALCAKWEVLFADVLRQRDLANARASLHAVAGLIAGALATYGLMQWRESPIGAVLLTVFAICIYGLPFAIAAAEITRPQGRASSAQPQEPPSSTSTASAARAPRHELAA